MGKPLDDRQVEYCWLTKALFLFNLPTQDAQGGLAGYNHSAVLFYQLQDANRGVLTESQEKIQVKFTEKPITAADMVNIANDEEVSKKISDSVAAFKLKKSGYETLAA